jgi:hypothetical protein
MTLSKLVLNLKAYCLFLLQVVPGAVASNQVVCSRLNYITQELHSDQSTPNQYQKYRKFVSESGIAAEELITEPASGSSKSSCRTSC